VLRLTTREHAVLFERVAPGVPLVVTVAAEAPLETRVALELAGFRVVTRPVTVEELLAKAALSIVPLRRVGARVHSECSTDPTAGPRFRRNVSSGSRGVID
jgi:hypothetical protein